MAITAKQAATKIMQGIRQKELDAAQNVLGADVCESLHRQTVLYLGKMIIKHEFRTGPELSEELYRLYHLVRPLVMDLPHDDEE